jgi:hypothetical protein
LFLAQAGCFELQALRDFNLPSASSMGSITGKAPLKTRFTELDHVRNCLRQNACNRSVNSVALKPQISKSGVVLDDTLSEPVPLLERDDIIED